MATVNFYEDIFSENFTKKRCKKGQKLKEVVDKYFEEKDSFTVDYEVYDVETGKTTYVKKETSDFKAVVIVNGNEETLDYKIKSKDIVNVIILPLSSDSNIGSVMGYVLGGIVTAIGVVMACIPLISYAGFGFIAMGASILGMTAAGLFNMSVTDKKLLDLSTDEMNALVNAENKLSIAGGGNQDITGNRFPIILGKNLVNPFIIGSQFNTTVTKNMYGEEVGQYVTQMYCLGYAPLKLTDLKIGDIILSYNGSDNDPDKMENTIHGSLKYNTDGTGAVLPKWKNNDVEVEILQAGDASDSEEDLYGTLYTGVTEQISPNANILKLKDGVTYAGATAIYQGVAIDSNYQSNSVYLSHGCPLRIEVDIDFPSGLYASRTQSRSSSWTIEKYSISEGASIDTYYRLPVRLAIQWRYANSNNTSSDTSTPDGWNNFDYIELKSSVDEVINRIRPTKSSISRKIFEYWSSKGMMGPWDYTEADPWNERGYTFNFGCENEDATINGYNSYTYNELYNGYEYTVTKDSAIKKQFKFTYKFSYWWTCGTDAQLQQELNRFSRVGIYPSNYTKALESTYTFYYEGSGYGKDRYDDLMYIWENEVGNHVGTNKDHRNPGGTIDGGYNEYETIPLSEVPSSVINGFESGYRNYIYASRINIEDFPLTSIQIVNADVYGHNFRKLLTAEQRYTVVKEFTLDEIKTILNTNGRNLSSMDSIEVRVIRITPCYLNQEGNLSSSSVSGNSTSWTNMKYNDLTKWTNLRTITFDKEKMLNAIKSGTVSSNLYDYRQRLYSEEDARNKVFVALRLKQDVSEVGGASLNKFSCIAEAMGPNYNQEEDKWYPENILPEYAYFKYSDGRWFETTYQDYDEHKTSKDYRKRRKGTDLVKSIKTEIFSKENKKENPGKLKNRWILPTTLSKKYINPNTACQYVLALTGPFLKRDAKTYDNINMGHVTDLFKTCEKFSDGTRVSDGSNKLVYLKMCCNAVISNEIKLETLLYNILLTGRATLARDSYGRYDCLIGREVDYPVNVLNDKNIISRSNSKMFSEDISGYLVTYLDESDNYNSNSFYVMADGEDYRNPTGVIESFELKYITNTYQLQSLVKFNLAARLYQKEVYTRTVGKVGYTLNIGDVLLMQDNSLLIGTDNGGRIKELIKGEQETVILGFVIDDMIEWTGNPGKGVTIVQPSKYAASRVITLEIASKEEYPDKEIGLTNIIYLKYPVTSSTESTEDPNAEYMEVTPQVGNLVSFGELASITEQVQIMGIKPKDKDQFDLSLVPYTPELYNCGSKLPIFQTNMTKPQYKAEDPGFNTNATLQDVNEYTSNAITSVNASLLESIEAAEKAAVITLYRRSETMLTKEDLPEDNLVYLFSNAKKNWESGAAHSNHWYTEIQNIPEDEKEYDLYITTAAAMGNFSAKQDIITPEEWTEPGQFAKQSKGIADFKEYYLTTAFDSTDVDSEGDKVSIENGEWGEWSEEITQVNAEKPYLWNYEYTKYSDGSDLKTQPAIIGMYGSGRGILFIDEYYCISDVDHALQIDNPDIEWIKADSENPVPQTTEEKPYLWNYEVINYSDGTTENTVPSISSIRGSKGYSALTLSLYKRSAEKPDVPKLDLTYNLESKLLEPSDIGWSRNYEEDNGNPLWVISANVVTSDSETIIKPNEWSEPSKIVETSIPMKETPSCYAEIQEFGFAVNENSIVVSEQYCTTTVHVTQLGEELDFGFGTIEAVSGVLPEGITAEYDGKKFTLRLSSETDLSIGKISFKIPVQYNKLVKYEFPEGNYGYVNGNALAYCYVVKSDEITTDYIYCTLEGCKGYRYKGSKYYDDITGQEYLSAPWKNCIMGDYFVFKGKASAANPLVYEDVESNQSESGKFAIGHVYSYTGKKESSDKVYWVEETNPIMLANALPDVLSTANTKFTNLDIEMQDLITKQTSSELYVGKLVSSKLFADTLTSNTAFIDNLISNKAMINDLISNTITMSKSDSNTSPCIQSSDYKFKEKGFYLGYKDGEPYVQVTNGYFVGDVVAKSLTIQGSDPLKSILGNNKIPDNYINAPAIFANQIIVPPNGSISSSNYDEKSSGWYLGNDGLRAMNGYFRGRIDAVNGSFSGTLNCDGKSTLKGSFENARFAVLPASNDGSPVIIKPDTNYRTYSFRWGLPLNPDDSYCTINSTTYRLTKVWIETGWNWAAILFNYINSDNSIGTGSIGCSIGISDWEWQWNIPYKIVMVADTSQFSKVIIKKLPQSKEQCTYKGQLYSDGGVVRYNSDFGLDYKFIDQ